MPAFLRPIPVPTLDQVLAVSGIVPVEDNNHVTGVGVTDNGTMTTQSGIVTNVTQAT